MHNTVGQDSEPMEVLLSLKSLLEFAKLSADEIAAQALAEAIDDARTVASSSIRDLQD